MTGLLFLRVSDHQSPNRPASCALLIAGTRASHAAYGIEPRIWLHRTQDGLTFALVWAIALSILSSVILKLCPPQ